MIAELIGRFVSASLSPRVRRVRGGWMRDMAGPNGILARRRQAEPDNRGHGCKSADDGR